MCDLNAIRIYVSPSYRAVLGYEPEELLGVTFFSQSAREEPRPVKEEFLTDERMAGIRQNGAPHARHKDGQFIWIDTSQLRHPRRRGRDGRDG